MERKFSFATDEYYHVYNRGVDKKEIFKGPDDYRRFMELMYACNSEMRVDIKLIKRQKEVFEYERGKTLVDIGAWCLMPNHFHLLVRVKGEKGLSEFLKKTLTGYSMYFNKKYKRTGSLFEGAFKAQHVDSDEYLKYLFAYIHLNPIKLFEGSWKESGIQDRYSAKKFLANYQLSSYLDFLRIQRPEKKILSTASFPDYFNNDVGSFDTYIKFWLDFTPHLVKVSP